MQSRVHVVCIQNVGYFDEEKALKSFKMGHVDTQSI